MLANGRSNPEIAKELFISPKTASVHVSNILAKLGSAGRVEAATLIIGSAWPTGPVPAKQETADKYADRPMSVRAAYLRASLCRQLRTAKRGQP